MRIAVLHQDAQSDAAVDELDVLKQRDAVAESLSRLGHDVRSIPCTLDLLRLERALRADLPDMAFNLVESLHGTDRLAPLVPLMLDSLRIPYSGSPALAMLNTASKTMTKSALREAGIPTPDWQELTCRSASTLQVTRPETVQRWILKPVWEHASVGMLDDAVQEATHPIHLQQELVARETQFRQPYFAEAYVEGREFNLSLIANPSDDFPSAARVLPPAEIDFSHFPHGKPRIVGYRAKWDASSFEYHHTPRRFEFPAEDTALLQNMSKIAMECWHLFAICGYARVDFRVDSRGSPWVLEINTNPCLSPDAGFAAALHVASISFDSALESILTAAIFRHERTRNPTQFHGTTATISLA